MLHTLKGCLYAATSPQGQARTVPSSLAVSKTHVNAISPTTPLLVLLVLSAPLVLLVCSLCSLSVPCAPCLFLVCSSLVIQAVFMLLLVLCAPCAPCLFLVLFTCIVGGIHALFSVSCGHVADRCRSLRLGQILQASDALCPVPSPPFLEGPQEALAGQLGRRRVCGLAI